MMRVCCCALAMTALSIIGVSAEGAYAPPELAVDSPAQPLPQVMQQQPDTDRPPPPARRMQARRGSQDTRGTGLARRRGAQSDAPKRTAQRRGFMSGARRTPVGPRGNPLLRSARGRQAGRPAAVGALRGLRFQHGGRPMMMLRRGMRFGAGPQGVQRMRMGRGIGVGRLGQPGRGHARVSPTGVMRSGAGRRHQHGVRQGAQRRPYLDCADRPRFDGARNRRLDRAGKPRFGPRKPMDQSRTRARQQQHSERSGSTAKESAARISAEIKSLRSRLEQLERSLKDRRP